MLDPFVILSVVLILPVVLLLRFIGCTSFGSSDEAPATVPVTLDPSDPTMKISLGPGETQQFTAKVDDMTTVDWSATTGMVNSAGLYTAPDPFILNSMTATITATKHKDSTAKASVTVTLIDAALTLQQSTASAKPGEVVAFTASVQHTPDQRFAWTNAVPDAPLGPTAKYTAPASYVLGSAPVTITVVSQADANAKATATVTLIGNAAAFVKQDTVTQGGWKRAAGNVYGKDGFALADSPTNIVQAPVYLFGLNAAINAPSPPGSLLEQTYVPKDARDLADPANLAKTIAATWYTAPGFKSFQIDLQFGDSQPHQIAVYSAIWDGQARAQIVSIVDGDNPLKTLDTRKLSGFDTGVYLVWNVSGHIVLQVANDTATNPISPNAVISGIFLG